MINTNRNGKRGEKNGLMRADLIHTRAGVLLLLIVSLFYSARVEAEPNTGSNKARSPKCESEYQQCANNCVKTQIDIGNQIQQCKDKCARDTDMYCSRTLTSGGATTNAVPKGSVGTLQNAPVNNPPKKTPPTGTASQTGGAVQKK